MLYCNHCKVSVRGADPNCPLCQNPLTGTPEEAVFPDLPGHRSRWGVLLRALLFLSFAAVVLCLAINALLPGSAVWPWYVAAAVGCMWVCLANMLFRRRNLPKNISWLVFWVSMLSLGWDFFTGWHRWSLDYVIPSLCMFATFCVLTIPRIMGKALGDYMIYVIIDALFGLAPFLFLWMQWVRVRYPSVLCVTFSALVLGALAAFRSKGITEEPKKRLHM